MNTPHAPAAPPTPAGETLSLTPVNDGVYSVHRRDGRQVGNLKRIGAIWKFKAVGHDRSGAAIPGGGPLTGQHNALFESADAAQVSARLAPHLAL